ncbi:MAG: hypothetical protein Q8O79_02730 [Pseudomonadota bacterium]|nr:hypothetical protein [Pseudomonadota bacterium]
MYSRRVTTRRTASGETCHSYRLVESRREGSRVRHFDLPEALWPALCARLGQLLGNQGVLVPVDLPEAVETHAQALAARFVARAPVEFVEVDVASLELVQPQGARRIRKPLKRQRLRCIACAATKPVGARNSFGGPPIQTFEGRLYMLLTDLESVFRSLKSELGLRPVYHLKSERADGHLFISVPAYQCMQLIRRQLKAKGMDRRWSGLHETLSVQRSRCRFSGLRIRRAKNWCNVG